MSGPVNHGPIDATPSSGSTPGTGTVTLAMLATIATKRILGRVTAATGAVESLTDVQANQVLAETPQVLTDAATVTWDAASGATATLTVTANRTLANISNPVNGGEYVLLYVQNATGGWVPAVGSKFDRVPRVYQAPGLATLLRWVYRSVTDTFYIQDEAPPALDLIIAHRPISGTSVNVWTNQPAARTELTGSSIFRATRDLRSVKEVQLIVHVGGVPGPVGAKFAGMFSIDGWTTPVYLDGLPASTPIGAETPQVAADGINTLVSSGWVALAAAAKTATTSIAVHGSGGDGAVDPTYNFVILRLR